MKNLCLTALAATILFSACKKDETTESPVYKVPFSISDNTSSSSARAVEFEIEAKVGFKNLTENTIQVVWERFDVVMPEGWESAVCDNELCHVPTVSTKIMQVSPFEEFDFKSVMRPGGVTGTGSCKIRLYDKADSARSVQVIDYTIIGI